MKTRTLVLAVLLTSTVAIAAVQERVKKKTVADFSSVHSEIGRAWGAQKYGLCMERTRDLLALITIKRTEVILSAFPPAPAGYQIVREEEVIVGQTTSYDEDEDHARVELIEGVLSVGSTERRGSTTTTDVTEYHIHYTRR